MANIYYRKMSVEDENRSWNLETGGYVETDQLDFIFQIIDEGQARFR